MSRSLAAELEMIARWGGLGTSLLAASKKSSENVWRAFGCKCAKRSVLPTKGIYEVACDRQLESGNQKMEATLTCLNILIHSPPRSRMSSFHDSLPTKSRESRSREFMSLQPSIPLEAQHQAVSTTLLLGRSEPWTQREKDRPVACARLTSR